MDHAFLYSRKTDYRFLKLMQRKIDRAYQIPTSF